ncbi:MAG: hypothetical protein FJ284_08225 [Planctomycetes bacterium]|nr:hypothetical protein [Planctomycetota bacterium]
MYDNDDDEWDDADDDEADTLPCPACGQPIFEDSPRCPTCGEYVTAGDASPRRPVWVLATAVVCLALAVWWAIAG